MLDLSGWLLPTLLTSLLAKAASAASTQSIAELDTIASSLYLFFCCILWSRGSIIIIIIIYDFIGSSWNRYCIGRLQQWVFQYMYLVMLGVSRHGITGHGIVQWYCMGWCMVVGSVSSICPSVLGIVWYCLGWYCMEWYYVENKYCIVLHGTAAAGTASIPVCVRGVAYY